jgi:cholecystokinin-like receptor
MEIYEAWSEESELDLPNVTEIFKLDRNTLSSEISNSSQFVFSTKSTNFNLSFASNYNQQAWITTASSIIPLYSVIFLLAVIGNSLVILTLVQSKRMRTITNLFLLNLAISDLFLGVFCMPFTLVGMLLRDFIFGELMCKLLPYLQGERNIELLCIIKNTKAQI